MEDIKRILAVSWMTQYCRKTIHYGISLARKYGAELTVIHVVDTLWLESWNLPMVSKMEERKKDMENIREELDNIIKSEIKAGMEIKRIVKEGDPVKVILNFVWEDSIDLIILRAHRESRLEHFLVGSSNDAIIRGMPCSILLVKKEPGSVP